MNRNIAALSFLLLAIVTGATAAPVLFVAPMSNNTGMGRFDEVAAGMTDVVMVLLARGKQAQVVERRRLRDVLREQKLAPAGLTDRKALLRVGRLLRANRIISGGLILAGGRGAKATRLTATLHVWNTADGRLIGSATHSTAPSGLLELGLALTAKLGRVLEVRLAPIDPSKLDANPLAGLHYMRGLGYFHAANYDRAIMEFFRTTGLDPVHDRAAFHRALCYVRLKEHDHAVIELESFLKTHHDSSLVGRARKLLKIEKPLWAGHIPALRAKQKARKQKGLFPKRPVFSAAEQAKAPTILLLATADFVKRYKAEPFARLIRERIGARVILLPATEAPKVGPLDGHKLIPCAETLLKRLQAKDPAASRLLVLTEAALETDMDDRVPSERWPAKGGARVIVASCLWLHMHHAPDLRKINPLAPPLPEHPEFYNFVLGCAAQLCGAGTCPTFGCPVNQEWYLWDQRYYKSWLCRHCRQKMCGAMGLATERDASSGREKRKEPPK